MYYDLITSLPHLPYFEHAQRLPVTPLRLKQRLRLLNPDHAEQLARAESLVRWRPDRLLGRTDAALVKEYNAFMDLPLEQTLREYVALRMEQQTFLAALRRKRDGLGLPNHPTPWGAGPRVHDIRLRWDEPHFRLARVYSWATQAQDLLAAGDALGLERLLIGANWRWLDRATQQSMFGFAAVLAYVFKWDMLRAWLTCDADDAKTIFGALIDKVTHVEHS